MKGKGSGWLATYNYLLQRFGPDQLEKVKAALSEKDRQELFGRRHLYVTWFDFSSYMNFMLATDKLLGKGDLNIIREAGYACARDNFKGVYKFFISLTSPKFILNNANKVWKQYYDCGEVKVEWPGDKRCYLKLTGADVPLHHEWDQIPTLEEVVRLSGGENVRIIHPRCMARKDSHCLFEITWE